MKEKDIIWEGDSLWVGKTGANEHTIFKTTITHSIGFLKFDNKEQAIDNGKSLEARPDLVEKLIK